MYIHIWMLFLVLLIQSADFSHMRHGTAHLTVALAQIRCHGTTMLKWHQRLDTTKSRTPQKLKMQPENTPLEKGNHIPKNHFSGSMAITSGV